jgi:hypothetical protein
MWAIIYYVFIFLLGGFMGHFIGKISETAVELRTCDRYELDDVQGELMGKVTGLVFLLLLFIGVFAAKLSVDVYEDVNGEIQSRTTRIEKLERQVDSLKTATFNLAEIQDASDD